MAVDLEQINLKFTASIGNVSKTFDALERRLSKVNSVLSSLNTSSLDRFAAQAERFSQSLSHMGASAGADKALRSLSTSLRQISKIDVAGVATATNAITELGRAMRTLPALDGTQAASLSGIANAMNAFGRVRTTTGMSGLVQMSANIKTMMASLEGFDPATLQTVSTALLNLANSLNMLGRTKVDNAIKNLPLLTKEMENLMQSLARAPTVSQNVLQVVNAMSKLASNGNKVGTAAAGLNRHLYNTGTSGTRAASGLRLFGNSAKAARGHVKSLASIVGGLVAKYWILWRAIQVLGNMAGVASSLTEVQNVVNHTFGDMQYKLEDFAQTSIDSFGLSTLQVKQYASRFQSMGLAMGITNQQVAKSADFVSAHMSDEAKALYNNSESLADMSINLTKLAADYASFYDVDPGEAFEKLQSVFTGQTRPLRAYGLDLTQATLAEWALKNGIDADVASMSQAEKTMLRYQYVMANSEHITSDFARTSDTFHNTLTRLKANFLTLQGTIGASLVNLFKPVLVIVNNAIVVINQFAKAIGDSLGKILGWKYEIGEGGAAIEDTADYVDDIGDAAGGAGKAVKDLKKQLQGFDELNNLTSDDDNGGGGRGSGYSGLGAGGSSARAGQWVETEKLFESDWDTWFKLGAGISEAWTAGLESIPWDEVYTAFSGFGTGLANFLNGLITPNLFSALGTTIGNALNAVVQGALSFEEGFDFANLGVSLATGVNAFAAESANLENLGKAIGGFINGAMTTVNSFLTTFDAAGVASNIASGVNGLLSTITDTGIGQAMANLINKAATLVHTFFNETDWNELRDKVASNLNEFIGNVDMNELGETLHTVLSKGITTLIGIMQQTDWEELGKKIGEFINALDPIELGWELLDLAWNIVKAIGSALVGLMESDPLSGYILTLLAGAKLTGLATTLTSSIAGALGSAGTPLAIQANGLKVKIMGATLMFAGFSAMLSDDTSLSGALMSSASIGLGTLMITGNPYIAIAAATIAGMINLLKIDNATVEQYIMDQEEQGMYNDAAASKLAETGTLDFSDWEKYSNYTNDMVLDMDRAVEELRAAGYTEKDIAYELSKYSGLSEYIANTQAIANSRKAPDWLKKVVTQVNNPKPSTTSSKKDNSTNPMGMGGSILSLNSGSLINDLSNVNEMMRSVGETTKNVSSQVSTETATMSTNANANFASLSKSASTNASLTSTSWAGNLSAMASKTTADTSSMTSTIKKWGSNITQIVSNTKPKATLGVDMTSESTVSTQYGKLTNIWKPKTSDFKINSAATTADSVKTNYDTRAGKWNAKGVNFTINSTASASDVLQKNYNERANKWNAKGVNFSINSAATTINEVQKAWSGRSDEWKNKTSNFAVKSVTSSATIQGVWNQLSGEWKNKTSDYAVKSVTSSGSIQSVWNQLANQWHNKTSDYAVKSVTSSDTVHSVWQQLANQWQDYDAQFRIDFSASMDEAGNKVVDAVTKGSFNKAMSLIEEKTHMTANTLPRLATGGVVDRATLAMIGEAGAEAVVPLEKNTQWLGKMADMLAQEMAYKEYTPPAYGSATYNGSTSYSGSATASSRAREEAIAEQNMLLREEIALLRQIAEKDLTIGDSDIFNATRRGYRSYVDRTGDSPFM